MKRHLGHLITFGGLFILAAVILLAMLAQPAPLEPWTIVCDGHGRYNFTFYEGTIWLRKDFENEADARSYMEGIRMTWEALHPAASPRVVAAASADEERARQLLARKWGKCR